MAEGGFWEVFFSSLPSASGDIIAIGMILIAVLFIMVKYYIPERASQKKFEMEMQQKQLELEAKRQQDNVDVQKENIESRTRQMEILSALTDNTKALTTQTTGLATNIAVAITQLDDSRAASKKIGATIDDVSEDVAMIKEQVKDIHTIMINPEGTD